MITESEAREIAGAHVAAQPAPADGYSVTLGRMVVVPPGWYFDYEIECDDRLAAELRTQFGGALGFIVDRESGDVSIVMHSDWVDLGLAFCDDPYGDPIEDNGSA